MHTGTHSMYSLTAEQEQVIDSAIWRISFLCSWPVVTELANAFLSPPLRSLAVRVTYASGSPWSQETSVSSLDPEGPTERALSRLQRLTDSSPKSQTCASLPGCFAVCCTVICKSRPAFAGSPTGTTHGSMGAMLQPQRGCISGAECDEDTQRAISVAIRSLYCAQGSIWQKGVTEEQDHYDLNQKTKKMGWR